MIEDTAFTVFIWIIGSCWIVIVACWIYEHIFENVCYRTARWQRDRIIDLMKGKSELGYKLLTNEWDEVSFYDHQNALMKLRKPIYLYGPLTQELWFQKYG